MEDKEYYESIIKPRKFLEELECKLKKYNPKHFAETVSLLLYNVLGDINKMRSYPPHFLLHSIEFNCSHHRKYLDEVLTQKSLNKIVSIYLQYYDPVSSFFLTQQTESKLTPFMINMARQQFEIQRTYGIDDLGRTIIIFSESFFPKTCQLFLETFGLSFEEWITISFFIQAKTIQHFKNPVTPLYVSASYFINNYRPIVDEDTLNNYFGLSSYTPEEVRDEHNAIRNTIGVLAKQFETFIPSVFTKRPLLRFDNEYLIIHPQLILKHCTEGIYDICKTRWQDKFGNEFGKAFENYIKMLLEQYFTPEKIIKESGLKREYKGKICDFVIIDKDTILLIECKATEFSSYIASENAIKSTNSTKKINSAIIQLIETGIQLKKGIFDKLIEGAEKMQIVSIVVTFKHLYFTNSEWYWKENINEELVNSGYDCNDLPFILQPQILSIDELEKLLYYSKLRNSSIKEIFSEKLSKPFSLTGDWSNYLQNNIPSYEQPFLDKIFDEYFNSIMQKYDIPD